jgi:hypothetical protein
MRKLLALGLLLLVTIALAQPPQVGSLYTRDMSGSLSFTCTASVVSGADLNLDFENAILTAAHCVDRAITHDPATDEHHTTADYLITFDESDFYGVQLVRVGYQNRGYDVAVLRFTTREPDVTPIRIGSWTLVKPGTRIENWASPLGLGVQRFEGYISLKSLDRPVGNASLNWRGYALGIIPSAGGSSGSLILSEGRVIGVLIGSIAAQRGAEFTAIVPQSRFAAFLSSDGAGRSISY